ncbi:MAG: hypothetical protein LIO52_03335 [Oscillospiraceae bacterium]|nr:hypothetical protein [Oscillospiraceae bacterium]
MENQQNPNPNSLLDVDLDAIAAAGKKRGQAKKNIAGYRCSGCRGNADCRTGCYTGK